MWLFWEFYSGVHGVYLAEGLEAEGLELFIHVVLVDGISQSNTRSRGLLERKRRDGGHDPEAERLAAPEGLHLHCGRSDGGGGARGSPRGEEATVVGREGAGSKGIGGTEDACTGEGGTGDELGHS